MFKHQKKWIALSSVLILLPALVGIFLWEEFCKAQTAYTPSVFLVIAPSLTIFLVHLLCAGFSMLDKTNDAQSRKVTGMVLWICPMLSILISAVNYALLLGLEFSMTRLMMVGLGLFFAFLGNFMPKTRQNATIGIKVYWTYTSEANWNATHRFAGFLWFVAGIILACGGLLGGDGAVALFFVTVLVIAFAPMVYAWRFYRREKQEGKELKVWPMHASHKKANKIITGFTLAVLIIVGFFLFTGDIEYRFDEETFTVEADYYGDLTIRYENIEAMEYREGNMEGSRVGGFGSFRLLMGWFENEELGTYNRYTYYDPGCSIVLTVKGRPVVLSGENEAETKALFEALQERIKP